MIQFKIVTKFFARKKIKYLFEGFQDSFRKIVGLLNLSIKLKFC